MNGGERVRRVAQLVAIWFALVGAVVGDRAARSAEQAAAAYAREDYPEALRLYREAQIERPNAPELHYNVGSALAQTGDLEAARQELERAAASGDPALQARAWYNLGNVQLQNQAPAEAAEAYRRALRLDPDDVDAKANLELALQLQPPPQQQSEGQDQSEQQQDEQQGQSSSTSATDGERPPEDADQGQRRPLPPGEHQEQQQAQQQEQQEHQEQQQAGTSPSPQSTDGQEERQEATPDQHAGAPEAMSPEEAEQLLDALRDREQQAQMRRMGTPREQQGHDW